MAATKQAEAAKDRARLEKDRAQDRARIEKNIAALKDIQARLEQGIDRKRVALREAAEAERELVGRLGREA